MMGRSRADATRARHCEAQSYRGIVATCAALAAGLTLLSASAVASAAAGQAPPRQTAQAMAPVDLTGYWVSVVSEDWQWRMITPPKGDVASLPLNPEGTRLANQWDPAQEGSCKAYGAAAIMRMPGRVHITWEGDSTLKIDTDAGQQTRRLRFNANAAPPAARDLQGHSRAQWEITGQAAGSGAEGGAGSAGRPPARWATLKVVTTNMRAGWLRKNGVPYSDNAVMTEYFDRFSDGVDEWFTVTTMIEDPTYLTQPLVVSSNFKKEPDGSKFMPSPCKAG
jgi:hypothetical protein